MCGMVSCQSGSPHHNYVSCLSDGALPSAVQGVRILTRCRWLMLLSRQMERKLLCKKIPTRYIGICFNSSLISPPIHSTIPITELNEHLDENMPPFAAQYEKVTMKMHQNLSLSQSKNSRLTEQLQRRLSARQERRRITNWISRKKGLPLIDTQEMDLRRGGSQLQKGSVLNILNLRMVEIKVKSRFCL